MIKKAVKELNWRILLFGVFFIYFYDLLLYRYAPNATVFINNTILLPLMLVIIGIIFFVTDIKKEKLFWASVVAFGFLSGLCLLNSSGLFPHGILIAFSTIGCFFVPYIIKKGYLEGFVKAFMASFITLYSFFGVLSIITVLKMFSGEEWAFGWLLRIKLWAGRLYVINHPNFTGLSFLIAAFFAIILLRCTKARFSKILLSIALVLFAICTSLANSRSTLLAACACMGILAGSFFYQKVIDWQLRKKIIGTVISVICGVLAVLILNFAVLSVFNIIGSAFSDKQQQAEPTSSSDPYESEQPGLPITTLPEREIVSDSIQETLNGRGYLWQGIFKLIESEPIILLKGISPFNHRIMEKVIPFIPAEGAEFITSYTHTHCGYLYILLAFGIPGLILTGLFLVLLLKSSISLVFIKKADSGMPVYLFPAFITLILAAEVTESFITNNEIGYIMPVFFLLAGCICFYAKKSKEPTEK